MFDRAENDPDIRQCRSAIAESSTVIAAFEARRPDGAWGDLGRDDTATGTAWTLSWLLQLGVSPRDNRLVSAARALVNARQVREKENADQWPAGAFSFSGDPADVASCVTGDDLAITLTILGPSDEVRRAVHWLVQSQRHDGGWLHCHRWSWGAKGMRLLPGRKHEWPEESDPAVRSCRFGTFRALKALASLPEELRDPAIRKAITRAAEFFLARGITGSLESPDQDIAPKVKSFSASFAQLGTPVRQTLDMLAVARVLTDLGYGPDPRLRRTIQRIHELQQTDGRWLCESSGTGMWPADEQKVGAPSKRVTIDALALLRRVARSSGVELKYAW
jgi:hypothetical protein